MGSIDRQLLLENDIHEVHEERGNFTSSLRSLPPPETSITGHKSQSPHHNGITPLHIMIASGIGSMGIAFGVIPILVSQDDFHKYELDIIPIIGRSFCALILLLLSLAFLLYKVYESRRTENENVVQQQPSSISDHVVTGYVKIKRFICFIIWDSPSLLQVFVFGTGSMLTSVLNAYNNCDVEHRKAVANLIQDCIRIPSIFLQITFYTCYTYFNHVGTQKSLPGWHHVSIAVMIGAQVWLWISDTTEPLWTLDSSVIQMNTTAKNTSLQSGLEHFLEPFHVEFSTISIGLLYLIWNMTSHKEEKQNKAKYHRCTSSKVVPEKWWSSWTIHIISAIILALIYIVVSTIVLFSPCQSCDNNRFNVFRRILIYTGILILYFGLVLPSFTIYALYKLSSLRMKSSRSHLGQYLLVTTAIVVIVFYILRIFAAGYVLNQDLHNNDQLQKWMGVIILENVFRYEGSNSNNSRNLTFGEDITLNSVSLAYPFFIIFQVWFQTLLLMEAERRQNIPKPVKLILIYIIAMNLGEWLQTGIALGYDRDSGVSQMTPVMNTFFTETSSQIIRLCLYPFMVLYRFHSAVVAWEIIIEHDEDDMETKKIKTINTDISTEETEGHPRMEFYDAEDSSNIVESLRTNAGNGEEVRPQTSVHVHCKYDSSEDLLDNNS